MAQLFQKKFGPLLSRLEHADRHYGLGILIANCIGTRVRMGFLYRKAISGVFDCPRLGIYEVTPSASSPTLIITPDQVENGRRKLACAPCFVKAAPSQVHELPASIQLASSQQSPRSEDSHPPSRQSLFGLGEKAAYHPSSLKGSLSGRSSGDINRVLDSLQFPNALTATFDCASKLNSSASRSVSSHYSSSPAHSTRASVGSVSPQMMPDGSRPYTPTEPSYTPPPLPSSLPLPPGLFVSRPSQGSSPSPLALSNTPCTKFVHPAIRNPYNAQPDIYADTVVSPSGNTYQITAQLGDGAYASVMLGVSDRGGVYALKVQNIGKGVRLDGAEFVRGCVLENRCLQLAREKRIEHWVMMYESWRDSNNVFFVLELGFGTLRARLDGEHDDIEAKLWCWEMLSAVEALRDNQIVHSDIKPDNFLIVRDGSVVLSDFGLAQTPAPPGLLPTRDAFLAWRALPCGTPGYLAPEALSRRGGFVTHASDVFSLGVVFVELLGRIDRLLWDVRVVPPEYEHKREAWKEMGDGLRQLFLMENHWLDGVDIPEGSAAWDLCERMLTRASSVDELLRHTFFDDLLDKEGRIKYRHSTDVRLSPLRIEREKRDLTFEAWYRPGGAGPYRAKPPSFGPVMDGSRVVVSRWLKESEDTMRLKADPGFPSDFNWVYEPPMEAR